MKNFISILLCSVQCLGITITINQRIDFYFRPTARKTHGHKIMLTNAINKNYHI